MTEDLAGPSAPASSPLYSSEERPSSHPRAARPFFELPSPLSLGKWQLERSEFVMSPADPFAEGGAGATVVQSAHYREKGITFKAEMGDLLIEETPATVSDLSRRGARFSLAAPTPAGGAELKSFAFTGGHPGDTRSVLVGAVGSLSLTEKAHLKTVYLSTKEMLNPGGESDAARRGDVVGFVAGFDPYRGVLALEGELDFAAYDEDDSDEAPAVADSACRARIGGGAAGYRYSAQYERTGARYHILSGREPRRDREGFGLSLGKDFGVQALDFTLSRYNDNVERNPLAPTLYRYEGTVDYTVRMMETLPLGLQYRKMVMHSGREPEGGSRSGSAEEVFAGRVNYLAGQWDLGVRASYSQRTDLILNERARTAATFALAPSYNAGALTVAPDFSLRRSVDLLEGQRSDEYWAGVDIRGNALGRQLDYQVSGGFRQVLTDPPAARNKRVGAHLRLAYPLKRLLRLAAPSRVGVRGEYNGGSEYARRDSAYSLLVVLEGG